MVGEGKQLEKWHAYIESQSKRIKYKRGEFTAAEPAITLSRQTGAGAITFAEKLAEDLNERLDGQGTPWTVFDKNLINEVLKDHNLPDHLEQFMPEDRPRQIEDVIGDMLGMHPPNWKLVKDIGETIYRLAMMGRCIIVGRGANIITHDLSNVLHLRLVGSYETRVGRCMEYYNVTDNEARRIIMKQDRARRRYLLAYYDADIDDAMNFDLVIKVDRFTTEQMVDMVGGLVMGRRP